MGAFEYVPARVICLHLVIGVLIWIECVASSLSNALI